MLLPWNLPPNFHRASSPLHHTQLPAVATLITCRDLGLSSPRCQDPSISSCCASISHPFLPQIAHRFSNVTAWFCVPTSPACTWRAGESGREHASQRPRERVLSGEEAAAWLPLLRESRALDSCRGRGAGLLGKGCRAAGEGVQGWGSCRGGSRRDPMPQTPSSASHDAT